jgi:hypothetical protein
MGIKPGNIPTNGNRVDFPFDLQHDVLAAIQVNDLAELALINDKRLVILEIVLVRSAVTVKATQIKEKRNTYDDPFLTVKTHPGWLLPGERRRLRRPQRFLASYIIPVQTMG